MRLAYLDCFAGISGDMFLAALVDAGVPLELLQSTAATLNLDATLEIEKVDRSGISATKLTVLHKNTLAESSHQHPHPPNQPNPRSLTTIRTLIQAASLPPAVQSLAVDIFELLGQTEARIHNVPIDQIHFHEVGAVDAIVDIVCAAAGIVHLGPTAWHASPINVGSGTVVCAHGTFPVPAPATADLLRGFPTYAAHLQKELVTPTGAAILRTLTPAFGPQPAMRVEHIGYGAGTRNPQSFPNVLRLSLGEQTHDRAPLISQSHREMSGSTNTQTVAVLETAIDDMTPQLLAHVADLTLRAGALDVMLTPVLMKKGRPGTLLTVLCDPAAADRFTQLLLRETTTLGIRIRHDQRVTLARTHVTVHTEYGPLRVKVGSLANEPLTATPEFEDCRAAAAAQNVPLKQVLQAATAAYRKAQP